MDKEDSKYSTKSLSMKMQNQKIGKYRNTKPYLKWKIEKLKNLKKWDFLSAFEK